MYLTRRQTLALVVILSLTAVGGGILIWRQAARGRVTVSEPAPDTVPDGAEDAASQVTVHVCGAVKAPGVYILPAGARVYEAVAKAGGALPEADQEAVNLAAKVRDGEQIRLPKKGETSVPAPTAAGKTGGRSRPADAGKPQVKLPLRVNQATAAELEAVPGIGPVLAARIVAYRQANGPFGSIDDLLNVPGIGQKTLERLRPYLLVP